MKITIRIVGVVLVLSLVSMSVQASLLSNFVPGATVNYSNVVEDITGFGTGTFGGTYGTPITSGGDALDFNPSGLISSSSDGEWMETDARLDFFVQAKDGFHITELQFSEAGDARLYNPGASGTTNTYGFITATFFIDVLEVDGNTPVDNMNDDQVNPYGTFSLLADLGVNNWSGTATLDIQSIILGNVNFEFGATLIHITLDNIMYTQSETGTAAIIQKKDADGFSVTAISIPEPSSLVLIGLASSLIVYVRHRFIV